MPLLPQRLLLAAPPCDGKVVTVQPGEWCSTLAQREGLTLGALKAANPGTDCDRLQAGDSLCLPQRAACGREHRVQQGEGCDAIARAEGVPLQQLLSLNPSINADCTNLQDGQVLCLTPSSLSKPVAPASPPVASPAAPSPAPASPPAASPAPPPPPATGSPQPSASLPRLSPAGPCTKRYTPAAGEDCRDVLRKANTTMAELLALNPTLDADCRLLLAGQPVCVSTAPPSAEEACKGLAATLPSPASSLSQLAAQLGASIRDLQHLNANLTLPLAPGARVCIPAVAAGDCKKHTVAPGEYLYAIALQYKTTVESLVALNPSLLDQVGGLVWCGVGRWVGGWVCRCVGDWLVG